MWNDNRKVQTIISRSGRFCHLNILIYYNYDPVGDLLIQRDGFINIFQHYKFKSKIFMRLHFLKLQMLQK